MPMRRELIVPAADAGSEIPAIEFVWGQISEGLRSPDLLVMIILALVGLFASFILMRLFPFSVDVATALSQLS